MVSPRGSMEALAGAIAESGELPSETSVLLQEADSENDDADVSLPLLEITPVEVDNVTLRNTDLVGWITDSNGNRTGRVFHSEYEMEIQLELWTTKDDGYDPDELGEALRRAIYPYSSHGPDKSFEDGSGNPIEQITYFSIDSGNRADDLVQTPTVRRWSQQVELWGCEEFRTDQEYPVAGVEFPSSDSLSGDNNDTDSAISSQ
jgi:hypothetical protein